MIDQQETHLRPIPRKKPKKIVISKRDSTKSGVATGHVSMGAEITSKSGTSRFLPPLS
jgi:hypothetical protein